MPLLVSVSKLFPETVNLAWEGYNESVVYRVLRYLISSDS